ncbi:hypothetical protein Tel_10745 [Candidatus Tenderia electrophaga]|uniref:Outer membrane protein beta-barrel domain-containing protein n=1 Tax=Candidatus Tenderia electrophaga TaxID=1748243 RepID=A0A0S2TEQ1_9GAMM|nr:hypothetical protein Tel_10745 [Candidatus Tenderia electrophaga]
MKNTAAVICFLTTVIPGLSMAQLGYGPVEGDRELSVAGTGSSESDFDNGSFGITGDMGWYFRDNMVAGVRQSINYASIEGASLNDDFWNGATRGYLNYQFGSSQWRPFVGGSLGLIYGDGVNNSGFAGVELGVKYYVLAKTYILARLDYQWFFDDAEDLDDTFDDGAWQNTVGIGFNF